MNTLDLTAFDSGTNAGTGTGAGTGAGTLSADTVIAFNEMALELPDGKHRFVIEDVKFVFTSTKQPALNIRMRIEEDGPYDNMYRWVMFVLSPKAITIVARQYKALTGEKLQSMTPNDMIAKLTGRSGIALFKTKTNDDGDEVQEVRGIFPDRTGADTSAFDFSV